MHKAPVTGTSIAQSIPLHGLEHHAPNIGSPDSSYTILDTDHPLSNDDLASTFAVLSRREQSPAFNSTQNRTAILVGESALMASIFHTPEDTIVLLDISPGMVAHMRRYVEALRTTDSIDKWYKAICRNLPAHFKEEVIAEMRIAYEEQAARCHRVGLEHPALSGDAFGEASTLAQRKAIIPWMADLSERRDMKRLGKALRAHKASVTMLNLTNVLVCEPRFEDASQAARNLSVLPIASDVPILTTTVTACAQAPGSILPTTHPAGIFFGVDDLRINGGDTDFHSYSPGKAVRRAVHS